jgi:pyroglutamyl-peptidase
MKLLLTGFEPFGGENRNPSAEIVTGIPAQIGDAEIIKLILPVVRGLASSTVQEAVENFHPDVILSIGQAGGRASISVERVAVNLDDYRIPDNGGNQPVDEPIVPGGPDAYFCTLPIKEMVEAVQRAGIPAAQSLSAGTFVCNHVMYVTLN